MSSPARAGLTLTGLWRLLYAARPPDGRVPLGLALSVTSGGLGLVRPLLFGWVVDAALRGEGRQVGVAAAWLGGLLLATAVLQFSHDVLFASLAEWVARQLRQRFHARLLARELAHFTQASIGEALTRAGSDVTRVSDLVRQRLSTSVQDFLMVTAGVALMVHTAPALGLMTLVIVAPVMVATVALSKVLGRYGEASQEAAEKGVDLFHESLTGIETVRLFGREPHHAAGYRKALDVAYRAGVRFDVIVNAFTEGSQLLRAAGIVFILWRAGVSISEGSLTFGTLTTFFLFLFATEGAVGRLTAALTEARLAAVSATRLEEDEPSSLRPPLALLPTGRPASLALGRVSLKYPGREGEALRDLSVTFKAGRSYAIVGGSGAGKTSLFRLLAGLVEPTRGQVLVGGAALSSASAPAVREHLSVVPQEAFLFRTSLRENIRYGRLEATDAEVLEAAQRAGLGPLLEELPAGLGTEVGERGLQLSGGQRQRVAIARALLRAPAFLLLDEATSALDAESDEAIRQVVRGLCHAPGGPGLIVISHRLSTVQDVDEILVLDKGELVESGSHAQLMKAQGRYAQLVEHQRLTEEDAPARVTADASPFASSVAPSGA